MAKFITGKELTNEVYEIIHKAKKQLLIISPYIKLDDYFKKELFDNHKKDSSLHITIGFGKNEKNIQRSLKKEDLDYFKDFPNVSIVFIPNLHAKFYANDKKGVITSINLYDYSFKNNVEFGVLSESSLFNTTTLLGGSAIDKDAWDEAMKILKKNYTIFVRRPNYKKKILGKDYIGSHTLLDYTDDLLNGILPKKRSVFEFLNETFSNVVTSTERLSREDFDKQNSKVITIVPTTSVKLLSATNLGKLKDKPYAEVLNCMIASEYLIDKETITPKGIKMGLMYKENSKGSKWIVYPESLVEIL
jgi:hypothetical protein